MVDIGHSMTLFKVNATVFLTKLELSGTINKFYLCKKEKSSIDLHHKSLHSANNIVIVTLCQILQN